MCSVVMDTDDGMADYGLWDRTLMEVDLLEENYRHDDIDYANRGAFLESDPLLPLINTIVGVGGLEDDNNQLFLTLTKSERYSVDNRNSPVGSSSGTSSDLDLHHNGNFQIPGIVIKSEPYDAALPNNWSAHFSDTDNSSVTSGGRSPPGTKLAPFALPPTPPCSSDGESLPSPLSTPSRSLNASLSIATAISSALTTAEDGTLILTEEEKRTLIAEGYPIPSRLPLTKAEERSLKRIRRKIKNKISAQESRRKKKEYIESLEKKVKNLNEDNLDLRRRLENSENNNRTLAEQLCKYQSLLKGKVQLVPTTTGRRAEKIAKQE